MNIDTEIMENQGINLPYEQPMIKKYGTMKEMTLSAAGSVADLGGGSPGNENDENDPETNNTVFGDIFEDDNPAKGGDDLGPFSNSRFD